MKKIRVDQLLVDKGLADSRSQAQRLVMAGQVRLDDQLILKPSVKTLESSELVVVSGPAYVSRGGEKMIHAIRAFNLNPEDKICADVGASTGGFTDCLLQSGASKVYAVDVGKSILHWKLRQDPKVVSMEGTNARYLRSLPEPVSIITMDVSFISGKTLLPVLKNWLDPQEGLVIFLIKPQFEAGKVEAKQGRGVIRDDAVHQRVLFDVLNSAIEMGFSVRGLVRSPIRGPKGNVEFLALLSLPEGKSLNIQTLVQALFQ